MKFGKLQDISNVDFTLPQDQESNTEVFGNIAKSQDPPKIFVGCTGWSMREWVGKVYPPKTPTKAYLKHYAQQFNTIELNTTHYRIPTFETIEKWKKESTPDFRFCPKIPQSISHRSDLGAGNENLLRFCEAIIGLEEKLGCCFMQLPPYFGIDRLGLLENFLTRFPKAIRLAVELRHESIFSQKENIQKTFDLLQKYDIAWVITDVAGRRDVCHMGVSTDIAMVRFVGNGLQPTDYERIDAWVERMNKWTTTGLKEIYFFPHEPDNLLAPDLALYLVDALKKHFAVEVRGPKFYEADGGQMSLF
ncbi:MAG: DUF72 domain-containing protein [Bacteroidota bacterium]